MLCVLLLQGCIAGFAVASVFSLWVSLGAFITRPFRDFLPTRVDQCNVTAGFLDSSVSYNVSVTGNVTAGLSDWGPTQLPDSTAAG